MDRFVFDRRSRTYLLFPDKGLLTTLSESIEDGKAYVSISISMTGWGADPSAPSPNRNIVFFNESFEVVRPSDPQIYRFRFVKKEGMSGSIALVCDAQEWPAIKQRIVDSRGYLPIVYKATTEDYWTQRRLASLTLRVEECQALDTVKTLYGQLALLRTWMSTRTPVSGGDLEDWLQEAVDKTFVVQQVAGSFKLRVPTVEIGLEFLKELEANAVIASNPDYIRLTWLA